ncbi:hypothetical protein HRI_003238400 [Hibiscus trionum]|uniref:Uncharacterized protein n=1 Tax=Hibiscus trionum TaxID=183268 RepID=A0A9W7MCK7_HIBTR|nr:hypothetical protein HRI_003238400 [Hibiscus trionum]
MKRAKHIGKLSNNVLSFLLKFSSSNVVGGNSCTCLEEETCILKRHDIGIEALAKSSVTGALELGTVLRVVNFLESESSPQPVSYLFLFVKASVEAVSLLSDLMNYELPLSELGLIFSLPRHCVVESTNTLPKTKVPTIKSVKRKNFVKANSELSYEIAVRKKSATIYRGTEDRESSLFDPWEQGSFEGRRNVMIRREANNRGYKDWGRVKDKKEATIEQELGVLVGDFFHQFDYGVNRAHTFNYQQLIVMALGLDLGISEIREDDLFGNEQNDSCGPRFIEADKKKSVETQMGKCVVDWAVDCEPK